MNPYIYIFPIGYSLLAIPCWLFPIGQSHDHHQKMCCDKSTIMQHET